MDRESAVIRACHSRLRPILMTTLTTVLGLVPMALAWGEGAELRSPLAITVASGLTFSTLLTLVVIPAVYMAVPAGERATLRAGSTAQGRHQGAAAPEPEGVPT
jgi:HAE1 family hydrophobic/amphiphilic exporter-1